MEMAESLPLKVYPGILTPFHSECPKLNRIVTILSAIVLAILSAIEFWPFRAQ